MLPLLYVAAITLQSELVEFFILLSQGIIFFMLQDGQTDHHVYGKQVRVCETKKLE